MTVTADPPDITAEVPVVAEADADRRRPARLGQRVLSMAFVAAVVVVVAIFVVEDPLAHVWYQTRQHHLTSTFSTARPVRAGDPVAVIQIPSQDINVTVVQGVGPGSLRAGPGHRPSSPIPGQRGNSIVFGHETAWGGPFDGLSKLKVGDSIYVQSRTANGPGSPFYFKVIATRTAPAADRRPFASSDDYRLTLVTAAPDGGRRIVVAVSGTPGRLAAPGPRTTASTGPVAASLTWPILGFVAFALGLSALVAILRRRKSGTAAAVVALPLVSGLLLCLVLTGDTLFRSPLS